MTPYVTVDEVATRWRCHHGTVRRALRHLPYLRLGGPRGPIRIKLADLEAFERTHTRTPRPPLAVVRKSHRA